MNKIIVSLLSCLVVGALVAAFVSVNRHAAQPRGPGESSGDEISSMAADLRSLREDVRALLQETRRLGLPTTSRDASEIRAAVAPATDPGLEGQPTAASHSEGLKTSIISALEEDRSQREAKRQQSAEAKRRELVEMKEGPYDRFNLKVNSLGKALELTPTQKQSYYSLLKQAGENLKEARRLAMEATKETGATDTNPSRGPAIADKLRELQETAQKEFEKSVHQMLTSSQRDVYKELTRSAHDFQNLGKVKPVARGAAPAVPGQP